MLFIKIKAQTVIRNDCSTHLSIYNICGGAARSATTFHAESFPRTQSLHAESFSDQRHNLRSAGAVGCLVRVGLRRGCHIAVHCVCVCYCFVADVQTGSKLFLLVQERRYTRGRAPLPPARLVRNTHSRACTANTRRLMRSALRLFTFFSPFSHDIL